MARAIQNPALAERPVDSSRILCESQRADVPLVEHFGKNREHGRVQVKVEMTVDVVQNQTGGSKSRELRFDFIPQLLLGGPGEEIGHSGGNRRIAKTTARIDERWNSGGRQCGAAAAERQVKPNTQSRVGFCELDGLIEGGTIHHQAGRGENAALMRLNHGAIDGFRMAEVIGVNN